MNILLKEFLLKTTRIIPDGLYLRIAYRMVTGKSLHLNPPITYNEKLQWLKLNNRKDEYTSMVDKYEVRKFIEERVGDGYLIPTLGVWDRPEDIDFDSLPDEFVLKCTHDCGGLIICRDKTKLDCEAAKKKLSKCLKHNFYYQGREWPYKNVKPRIYAEKYMSDPNEEQLSDYKVFCFNGVPKIIQVDYDRYTGHKRQFFDTEWNRMDVSFHFPSDTKKRIAKPSVLEEMLELAKKLSLGFPHLRTDFYIIGNKLYVGEMTFFHGTGFGRWWPESFDAEMGSWLDLSNVNVTK